MFTDQTTHCIVLVSTPSDTALRSTTISSSSSTTATKTTKISTIKTTVIVRWNNGKIEGKEHVQQRAFNEDRLTERC